MSQDIRIEDWQWERLMEVLGAIDQNTRPTVTTVSTVQPEPEGVWVLESEHQAVMDRLANLGTAIALAEKAEQEHTICMGLLAATTKEAAALRAEREQQKNHPGWMDRIRRERQEERERIIALLDCEADMPEGTPALLVRNVSSGETLNAAQLRTVLEP